MFAVAAAEGGSAEGDGEEIRKAAEDACLWGKERRRVGAFACDAVVDRRGGESAAEFRGGLEERGGGRSA